MDVKKKIIIITWWYVSIFITKLLTLWEAVMVTHYPLCPLGLSSPGRECAAIPNPARSNYFRSYFEGLPLSPCTSTTGPFPYLRALGKQSSTGQKTKNSSILIPITCHYVTQVMHLRQPAEPWGYFFCFKYPQSKLLKISLSPPEAGCTGHLWPERSGD